MNREDVTGRIMDLAGKMDWRGKKILYFVSNTEQATLFLRHVNLTDTQLRLVRDKELSMFCNYIVIGKKVYPVENLEDTDFIWADEVVLMIGRNATEKFFERYADRHVEEKITSYDTPYELLQKTYTNQAGVQFRILDKIELDTKNEILENDIPFIEESLLSQINKGQEEVYYTYSMTRRNLVRGIYFDEKEIAEEKGYEQFNKNTNVVVCGERVTEQDFTEESLMLYKAIYGSPNVAYLDDLSGYVMEDGKDYIFIDAGVRMVSPYFTKYFNVMRLRCGRQDLIGLVSPKRTYSPEDIKIIWGSKKAFMLWRDNIAKFGDERYWYQYVMENCIVAEEAIFNSMDFRNAYVNCQDKENRIGYVEWMINKIKDR